MFISNSAESGGALQIIYTDLNLSNCTIYGNSAETYGGGISFSVDSVGIITNCIFWLNTAVEGPGIANKFFSSAPRPSHVSVFYSDIQGGQSSVHVDHRCTLNWGMGNIDADPLFVDVNSNNLHPLADSPCIDAGDNTAVPPGVTTDLDGDPRIENGTVDMGAYEYRVPVTIYVETNATGANNGSSWADAFNDLQDALAIAEDSDEILVAQGIYKPAEYVPPPSPLGENLEQATTTAVSREATFQLKNSVIIKGGYAGSGEPDPNARNIELYETILSGDLNDNDVEVLNTHELLDEPTRAENSYHVVTGSGTDATAVLDGFTIKGGNGGVTGSHRGGGMYNYIGSPTLTNCTFSDNSTTIGGGMYNFDSSSTVTNCTFSGNSANFGGGMYNEQGAVTLTNCNFIHNLASEIGGGMANFISSPTVTNCTFSGNSAVNYGGGISNYDNSPVLTNCILWGNTAPSGPQIHNYYGTSSATVSYSDVQGGWPGAGNINANPLFVDSSTGDCHLLHNSLCIDAGDPCYVAGPNETDMDGRPRIIYGRIDMGAYEFFNTPPCSDAGPDQVVECACNTVEGTKVTLDGTGSSDTDGDPLTYTWTGPFTESPADGATPTVTLEAGCPGEYVITLVVNDGTEDSEPNDVVITVVDTTTPDFELSVSPTMLWPPDHKMVLITPSWMVSDDCDAAPQVSLVGIVANEGDNTIGDGHTSNDIQIGEDGSIYLRSERSGTSDDRVYTITYQAIDDCGNTTVRSAAVSIPHDFKVLARIAAQWLWAGPGRIPEDLNDDGVVNLKDIAIFAGNWIQ
jgi:hypothetical protein